jgi:hypothetical protein
MNSPNEKHFRRLRDRVEYSIIVNSSLPELDSTITRQGQMAALFRGSLGSTAGIFCFCSED